MKHIQWIQPKHEVPEPNETCLVILAEWADPLDDRVIFVAKYDPIDDCIEDRDKGMFWAMHKDGELSEFSYSVDQIDYWYPFQFQNFVTKWTKRYKN